MLNTLYLEHSLNDPIAGAQQILDMLMSGTFLIHKDILKN
jgi:hypothetical protein